MDWDYFYMTGKTQHPSKSALLNRFVRANDDDDYDWAAVAAPERQLKLNIHRDQHAAAVNAAQAAIRRDILTILLEERDEFPVRTRIKIDDVAEECLQRYDAVTGDNDPDTVDVVADRDPDGDDDDGVGAIAAGGDVADDANHNNRSGIRIRLISLLDGYEHCRRHSTRDIINTLTELCLRQVEDDTHDMLCDQNIGANYRGLDSTRDTVKEVKAILRVFPNVLSKRKETVWVENEDAVGGRWVAAQNGRQGDFPIHCLLRVYGDVRYQCNFKAAPFIVVLAQLAIQSGAFEENERGGLLCEYQYYFTTFHDLIDNSFSVYSEQLIQLKQMNLFKKEDVRGQGLLLYWRNYEEHKFNENRFRWFVEWDPTSLLQTCAPFGDLPLHLAARYSTIQGFRFVFEFYIRYYPQKKGIHLLFSKNDQQETAFELACNKHPLQHDELRSIVETTLDKSDQPLNIVDALVTAAISERVHLDCVYTLFRRHHVTVVNALLLGPPNNNNNNNHRGNITKRPSTSSISRDSSSKRTSLSILPNNNGNIIICPTAKATENVKGSTGATTPVIPPSPSPQPDVGINMGMILLAPIIDTKPAGISSKITTTTIVAPTSTPTTLNSTFQAAHEQSSSPPPPTGLTPPPLSTPAVAVVETDTQTPKLLAALSQNQQQILDKNSKIDAMTQEISGLKTTIANQNQASSAAAATAATDISAAQQSAAMEVVRIEGLLQERNDQIARQETELTQTRAIIAQFTAIGIKYQESLVEIHNQD